MKKTMMILSVMLVLFASKSSAQTAPVADTAASFSIADSATFIGKYKYEGMPFEYMTISVQDGKLYYSGGEYNGTLDPIKDKKDAFDAGSVATFTFLRDSEHKVTGLQIDYQGQTYTGTREQAETK